MKKMILALAVVASAATASAYPHHGGGCYHCGYGQGDALTLGALFGSLSVSTLNCSANYDCKQVLAAQDDAAAYVASNGEMRSAALDQALQSLREANPGLEASDMDLASAILSAQ